MAADGAGGRAGHAADCAGTAVHAAADVRQCGQVLREVSTAAELYLRWSS